MGDERGPLEIRLLEQTREPAGEGVDVETCGGSGLAETGHVGNDDAVVLHEPVKHRRPHRTAAFDAAMQQDERRSVTALEDAGGDPVDVERPGGDRQPGEHPVPWVRALARASAVFALVPDIRTP